MKRFILFILACMAFTSEIALSNGVTKQIPKNVQCILEGTGAGYCRIIFSNDLDSTCPNKNMVAFNPETTVLGKELYSMALAAVSAKETVEVRFIDAVCKTSAATIDWVKYGK